MEIINFKGTVRPIAYLNQVPLPNFILELQGEFLPSLEYMPEEKNKYVFVFPPDYEIKEENFIPYEIVVSALTKHQYETIEEAISFDINEYPEKIKQLATEISRVNL